MTSFMTSFLVFFRSGWSESSSTYALVSSTSSSAKTLPECVNWNSPSNPSSSYSSSLSNENLEAFEDLSLSAVNLSNIFSSADNSLLLSPNLLSTNLAFLPLVFFISSYASLRFLFKNELDFVGFALSFPAVTNLPSLITVTSRFTALIAESNTLNFSLILPRICFLSSLLASTGFLPFLFFFFTLVCPMSPLAFNSALSFFN